MHLRSPGVFGKPDLLLLGSSPGRRHGVAAVAVLVALGARLALNPLLGLHAPYLPFTLAIMVAARIGGRRPGYTATAFSTLIVSAFLIEPHYILDLDNPGALAGLALFALVGTLISILVGDSRESEFFYRQTLESIPGMVFTTRPDGYCDYQSHQWVDYSGVPVSEHLGDGWNELLHPDDRARASAAWQAAVAGRAPYDLEYRVRRHDGVYEWFKVIGRPIRGTAGQIVRWFGVALNIEELQRAEEATRRALEQRSLVLEAGKLGAWDYRLDSGDVYWDERCRNMFGVAAGGQIEYEGAIARIHPDDREAVDQAVSQALAGANDGAYHREYRVVWPDGSVHWVASHGQVFFEGQGDHRRAVRFVGANLEITEQKLAQESLRQKQKLESIGLLAGGVAHDFNNLLTIIMGSADLALAECPSCEHSRSILSASKRATYLTKQLLAYAGKGFTVSKLVNYSELVSNSTELISASVPKRVRVRFNLADDLPYLEADPSHLEQILMNLAINAGEAIPPKTDGLIEIATSSIEVTPELAARHSQSYDVAAGRYVCLEVSDNGEGMDESTAARIFDPFFSTKFTGRGLGLAALQGIVRTARGFVEIRSAPGRGTTFRVCLPASEKKPAIELARSTQPRQLRGTSIVLVVDDEEMVRKLACITLQQHGYKVLEARHGQEALQVLAGSPVPPSVALVDLAMPVMGGDELAPILASNHPDLKIVMSSGYPEDEARRLSLDGSIAGFLQKPYTGTALAEKIAEVLEARG